MSSYLCSSGSNAQGQVEGPLKANASAQKTLQGLETEKREFLTRKKGTISTPNKGGRLPSWPINYSWPIKTPYHFIACDHPVYNRKCENLALQDGDVVSINDVTSSDTTSKNAWVIVICIICYPETWFEPEPRFTKPSQSWEKIMFGHGLNLTARLVCSIVCTSHSLSFSPHLHVPSIFFCLINSIHVNSQSTQHTHSKRK